MASDSVKVGFLLANRHEAAAVRFAALSHLFDRWTLAHLDALGVAPGWRCWEVGAGGEAIPMALAERVGDTGRVVATDIDIRSAAGAAGGVIEVLRHDVAGDPPPADDFDLVHARLVLVHVPDRERALANMIAALRPGGWLVVEDADPMLQPLACPDAMTDRDRLVNRIRDGFRTLLAGRGADLSFGRKLPRLFTAAGLEDVRAEGFLPLGGPAMQRLEAATTTMLADELVAGGHATREELDAYVGVVASGDLVLTTAPLITAWGRKPLGASKKRERWAMNGSSRERWFRGHCQGGPVRIHHTRTGHGRPTLIALHGLTGSGDCRYRSPAH